MTEITEPVKLFWTGGMDSTFRLAQLIFIFKKTVQPYYIIDNNRKSTEIELRTMEEIERAFLRKDPELKGRILPAIFFNLDDIPEDKEISESYNRLVKFETIGSQYHWLARFCKAKGLRCIELSLETAIFDKDNRTRKLLGNDLEEIDSQTGTTYHLSENAKGQDKYNIYGWYNFPAYDFTKAEKYQYSIDNNFDDIIRLTWFCHMPTKAGNPCGKCHPCQAAYREGLKWRLPFFAKIRYHLWPVMQKSAKILGVYNGLKAVINK